MGYTPLGGTPPCRSRGPAAPASWTDCEPPARRLHLCKARAGAVARRLQACKPWASPQAQRLQWHTTCHYVGLRAGGPARRLLRRARPSITAPPRRRAARPTCPQGRNATTLWRNAPTYFRALTQHCGTTGQTTACTYLYGVRAITYARRARRPAFSPNLAKLQGTRHSTQQSQQAGRHRRQTGTGLAIRTGMSATADRQSTEGTMTNRTDTEHGLELHTGQTMLLGIAQGTWDDLQDELENEPPCRCVDCRRGSAY